MTGLPNQTGWEVIWQDEPEVERSKRFALEDQVYALALEAEKARAYREALRRHRAGEEVFVPEPPECVPVCGLGLPVKRQAPEEDEPRRPKGKAYMRR